MQKTPTALMTYLMGFFGMGGKTAEKKPSGNRAMPLMMQKEVQAKAQDKRLRKLNRPKGWYNG